mgnify:CR=1 FL=1
MIQVYKDLLKDFKKVPGAVILYGSVSKEKSRPDSDIDIAVFSNDKKAKIIADKIADEILLKKGKVVSILWLDFKDLKKRINEPFIQDVLKGEILYGRKFVKRFSS